MNIHKCRKGKASKNKFYLSSNKCIYWQNLNRSLNYWETALIIRHRKCFIFSNVFISSLSDFTQVCNNYHIVSYIIPGQNKCNVLIKWDIPSSQQANAHSRTLTQSWRRSWQNTVWYGRESGEQVWDLRACQWTRQPSQTGFLARPV